MTTTENIPADVRERVEGPEGPEASKMTYDELVDRYQGTVALRQKIERRLRDFEPGTPEGYQWYLTLRQVEESERQARATVRNHPDAPPQG